MSLSGFSDAEIKTLAKYFVADSFYRLTIYHNKTFDALFDYINPMDYIESTKEAERVVRNADLLYNEWAKSELPSGDLVILYEGNRIRIMLLIKKAGWTPFIESVLEGVLEEFCKNFEYKYNKELKNWEETKVKLPNVDESIKDLMDLEQVLPHYAKYAGFDPDSKLGEYIYEAANEFTKLVGYFYFPNMVYLTKEHVVDQARKLILEDPKKAKKQGIDPNNIDFPPDEAFLIEMFKLKKKGLLRAIQMNELNSFSKIKY